MTSVWVEPCGSHAQFEFLTVKVNQIKENVLLSAPESIPVVWSLFYTCKVQNLISLGCCCCKKKDHEIKEHLPKFFLQNEKNALNHAVWFYAEPCMAYRHVQEEKKNKRRTELVRPHHSCQFEIMGPDLLGPGTMALDLTFGSFTLLEPVSH